MKQLLFILAALPLLLTACVNSNAYRTNNIPCKPTSFAYSPSLCGDRKYWLNVLEFNENGRLADPNQLDSAEATIRAVAARQEPLVLVLFIHGWHHNAKATDDNLMSFENVLAQVTERTSGNNVVGIYIGWRGESLALKPNALRVLSYFNRRDAADRMASSVQLADTLLRLGFDARTAYKEAWPVTRPGPAPSAPMIILTGHSFGGRILEHAVVPSILTSVHERHEINRLRPFNLIVLLNPAASALGTMDLIDVMRSAKDDKRPFLINVTSTADFATSKIFPISQILSGNHGPYLIFHDPDSSLHGEQRLSTHTAGHLGPFQSHTIVPLDQGKSTNDFPFHFVTKKGIQYVIKDLADPRPWNWGREPGPDAQPTPYWVIRVNKDIVKNHDDIFNEDVQALLSVLLVKTVQGEDSTTPYSQRPVLDRASQAWEIPRNERTNPLSTLGISADEAFALTNSAPYELYELYGFSAILQDDADAEALAQKFFDLSFERRESFHDVAEIRQTLRGPGSFEQKRRVIVCNYTRYVREMARQIIMQKAGVSQSVCDSLDIQGFDIDRTTSLPLLVPSRFASAPLKPLHFEPLLLGSLQEEQRPPGHVESPPAVEAAQGSHPAKTVVDPQPGGLYIVKFGDSLAFIAERAYGKPRDWLKIYRANNWSVRHPHWIHPGQILKIP
jgi:hypothetical protein